MLMLLVGGEGRRPHRTLRPTGAESGEQHRIPSGLGIGAGTFVVLNIVDWILICCLIPYQLPCENNFWKKIYKLNFHPFLKLNFILSSFEVLNSDSPFSREAWMWIRKDLKLWCCKHAYFCTISFWKYQKFSPKGHFHPTVSQGDLVVWVTGKLKPRVWLFWYDCKHQKAYLSFLIRQFLLLICTLAHAIDKPFT